MKRRLERQSPGIRVPLQTERLENSAEISEMARAKNATGPKVERSSSPDGKGLVAGEGTTGSNIDERIAMVIELMISSPMKSISVEAAAALLSISPSRLRHLFKEQVGIPIHKYEVMLRLERVRLLLRTTDCSVKETARMLGFMDMSNFSHMFKKAYGVTPGAARNMK
jgi:AraC-like DNA-binding protein